ncbi:MAG: FecR family protein [Pseudomonadales bacterium]
MNDNDRNNDLIGRLLNYSGALPKDNEETKQAAKARLERVWLESVAQQRALQRQSRLVRFAAAAIVVMAVVGLVRNVTLQPEPVALATIVQQTGVNFTGGDDSATSVFADELVRTAHQGTLTLMLNNGTVILLDDSTTLTLQGPEQISLLGGRVYVDSPGMDSNVIIDTSWGTVRDIGTQFELDVNAHRMQAALREGSIQMSLFGSAEPIVAGAADGRGDVVRVDAATMQVSKDTRPTTSPKWDWTRSMVPAFPAGRHSFAAVIAWVARQTGREVSYSRHILETEAQNEIVDWPSIAATGAEATVAQLVETTSHFTLSFSETTVEVSDREERLRRH